MNNFFDNRLYQLPISQKIDILNQFADRGDLNLLLEKASKLIGNPIVFSNPYYKVISSYPKEYINDNDFDTMISRGFVDDQLLYKYEMAEETFEGFHSINVRTLTARKEIALLHYQDKQIGQLIVYSIFRKVREEDYALLKLLCQIITLIELKKEIFADNKNSFAQCLLYDLIEDEHSDPEYYRKAFSYINANRFNEYIMLLFSLSKPLDDSLRVIVEDYENTIGLIYHGYYVMVMPRESYQTNFSTICKLLDESFDHVAISSPFRNLYEAHDIYRYLVNSLKAEKQYHLNKRIFSMSEISFYNTYASLQSEGIDIFYNHTSLEIVQYDKEHNTDYANSLFVYLLEFGNLKKASDRLSIHRNTLDYKIKKIQQLFSIDLNDFQKNFEILCSLKVILQEH